MYELTMILVLSDMCTCENVLTRSGVLVPAFRLLHDSRVVEIEIARKRIVYLMINIDYQNKYTTCIIEHFINIPYTHGSLLIYFTGTNTRTQI